ERRVAQLPGPLRALLEAASVLGPEFAHDTLAGVLGEEADALRRRCDGLARRGEWIVPAGIGERADGEIRIRYQFRHVLYQRVIWERCEPSQRLQHPLDAARTLAAAPRLEHGAAELAHHTACAHAIAAAGGARATALAADARRWRLQTARDAAA